MVWRYGELLLFLKNATDSLDGFCENVFYGWGTDKTTDSLAAWELCWDSRVELKFERQILEIWACSPKLTSICLVVSGRTPFTERRKKKKKQPRTTRGPRQPQVKFQIHQCTRFADNRCYVRMTDDRQQTLGQLLTPRKIPAPQALLIH